MVAATRQDKIFFSLFIPLLLLAMAVSAQEESNQTGNVNQTTPILVVQPNEELLEILEASEMKWVLLNVPSNEVGNIPELPPNELILLLEGSPLGKGVYLPGIDIFKTQTEGGLKIFTDVTQDVVIEADVNRIEYKSTYYESSNKFYDSVGAEVDISGNHGSVSASLKSTFDAISGGEDKISALTVDSVSFSKMKTLDQNKLGKLALNQHFSKELASLPRDIGKPEDSSSWTPFRQFLRKWGSHYISTEYTGSWMQQWSTSKSSNSYSQSQLKAHACLKLEGASSNMEACIGVSTENKVESSRLEINDKLYVKGGNPETRAALVTERTKVLVSKFMEEGTSSDFTVQYRFTPIWQVIFDRFQVGSDIWQIARNLQAYYEGYMGFGCPTITTTHSPPRKLQYFASYPDSSGSGKHFECRRACEGCKDDDDCHIGAGGAKCYCYGKSCVVLNGEGRPDVRGQREGGTWDGVNNSCSYKRVRCYCKDYDGDKACKNGEAVLWNQADENRKRELEDKCSCSNHKNE